MIVTNAKVYTQNDEMPKAEAFAVEDGKFACVGSNEEVRQWAADHEKTMEELDLGGKFIMPGIIDSHTHIAMSAFMGGDDDDDEFPMYDCKSKAEILEKLKDLVKKHPFRVFYAMFYGQIEALADDPLTRDDLDKIVRFRPVVLMESECHSAILNSAALRYFKIREDTPDIAPGLSRYDRDENGRLTGFITEMTLVPILASQTPSEKELRFGITKLLSYLISRGVTTIFDAGNMVEEDLIFQTFKAMDQEGKIPVRMFMCHMLWHPDMVPSAIEKFKKYKAKYETDNIRFETMKMMFDGTQRIHTACMVEPYADTGTCGGTLISEPKLLEFMRALNHEGIDFHLHTVGEAAMRKVMNCVERLQAEGEEAACWRRVLRVLTNRACDPVLLAGICREAMDKGQEQAALTLSMSRDLAGGGSLPPAFADPGISVYMAWQKERKAGKDIDLAGIERRKNHYGCTGRAFDRVLGSEIVPLLFTADRAGLRITRTDWTYTVPETGTEEADRLLDKKGALTDGEKQALLQKWELTLLLTLRWDRPDRDRRLTAADLLRLPFRRKTRK